MDYLAFALSSLEEHYHHTFVKDVSTPIEGVSLDALKTSRIVFQKEVWERLQNIALTTQVDEKEIGFLLYGKEFLPNQVYFFDIVLSDAPLKSIVAEFDPVTCQELQDVIERNLDARTVVAHGHSHPKINEKYSFFSLGDFASYVELTKTVPDFQSKDMQLVGCLVTPDTPIQFAYFNPADDKFYCFQTIEVES